jgi:hypothetical protein
MWERERKRKRKDQGENKTGRRKTKPMITKGKFKDEITNRLENNAAQWCVFARMRGREAPRDASEGWAGIEGSLAAHFFVETAHAAANQLQR